MKKTTALPAARLDTRFRAFSDRTRLRMLYLLRGGESCVGNLVDNRSRMAEAFARMFGGDAVEAASAGSRRSGRVNPRAVEFMKELGYDLTTHQSKALDAFNGQEIDVAVTMGCGDACPLVRARRREDWQIPDPKEMPPEQYRAVRDLIGQKVKSLLAGL